MEEKDKAKDSSQSRERIRLRAPSQDTFKYDESKANKGKANEQPDSDNAATEADLGNKGLGVTASSAAANFSSISFPPDYDSDEAESTSSESSEQHSHYAHVYESSERGRHDQGPSEIPGPSSGASHEAEFAYAHRPAVDETGHQVQNRSLSSEQYVYEGRELSYRRETDRVDDHRFWQPQRPHKFRRSLNTPTLESSYPRLRANHAGELQYGLRYVCDEFRPKWSASGELFLPASLCAYYLGYDDVYSMAYDKNLTIVSLRSGEPTELTRVKSQREEKDWAVSALSMFLTFGRLIVRDPEAPALDYPSMDSNMESYDGVKDSGDPKLESKHRNTNLPRHRSKEPPKPLLPGSPPLQSREVQKKASPDPLPLDLQNLPEKLRKDPIAAKKQLDAYFGGINMLVENEQLLLGCVKDLAKILDLIPEELLERFSPRLHGSFYEESGMWTGRRLERMVPFQLLVCQWELPDVFTKVFTEKTEDSVRDRLAQQLVITGSNGRFKCSSCLDLVKSYCGSSGEVAVDLLSNILKSMLQGKSSFQDSQLDSGTQILPTVTCAWSRSVLAVAVETSELEDYFLEAISWICSAIRDTERYTLKNGVCGRLLSRSLVHPLIGNGVGRIDRTMYDFRKLEPLQKIEYSSSPSALCWNKLFKFIPVLESSITWPWGRGLEISFSLMVELAAVENVCILNERTALLGFYTALLPTDRDEFTNSVQWHFLSIDPGKGPLLPTHLSSFIETSCIKLDIDTMSSMNCFLGWASNANIMLGTEELVERPEEMRSCRSLDLGKAHLEREQVQGVLQVSFAMPFVSLNVQGGSTWRWNNDVIERTRSSEYRQALNETRRKTCLVIDSHSKQAWLVPLLGVLFHLCHRYYQINKPSESAERTPLPYLQPTPHVENAVIDAIGHQHDLEVSGVRLSSLFHMLHINLVQCPRVNRAEYIYANDLMGVVESSRTYPRKVPLNGNGYCWPDLLPFAEVADAVAVCANIGQVLQVERSLGDPMCQCPNSLCYQLPQGRSYFAAHMSSISRLVDLENQSLYASYGVSGQIYGSEASWSPTTNPWRRNSCDGTSIWANKATANSVLQETVFGSLRKMLRSRTLKIQALTSSRELSHFYRPPTPRVLGIIPENGVVVFGRYKDH